VIRELIARASIAGPRYLAAIAAVAAMSVLIGFVEGAVRIANVSMLYLVVVLAVATRLGSGPAVLASILAFLTFDWFFVQPLHTFTVADPGEWISLVLFLVTAVFTGELAADQRRRAHEAAQREHEAVLLFDLLRLLTAPDVDAALAAAAERIRAELGLSAVGIQLSVEGRQRTVAVGDPDGRAQARPLHLASADILAGGRAPTARERGRRAELPLLHHEEILARAFGDAAAAVEHEHFIGPGLDAFDLGENMGQIVERLDPR